jgi:hypothetical protein
VSETENLPTDIWCDDRLARKEASTFLSGYLDGLYQAAKETGQHKAFVLNLNARWGFGKTFFLNRWKQELERAGHPVVYFDAWENDYTTEPLLGFIHQIEESIRPIVSGSAPAARALTKTLNAAKRVLKPTLPILLEIIAKRLTNMSLDELATVHAKNASGDDDEATDKVPEKIGSLVAKAAEAALKDHKTLKATIKEFKKNLASLCEKIEKNISQKQLPLFIFVDELDRCRPTYALELLEHIKHLFGVDGVYFVVSTDSSQLAQSLKAVYGAGFDSHMYLKRFFDQEYVLPEVDGDDFAEFLFAKYSLADDVNLLSPIRVRSTHDKTKPTVRLFAYLARTFSASLRTQEQACLVLRAIRLSMKDKKTHATYCLFLIFLSIQHPDEFASYCESFQSNSGQQWTREMLVRLQLVVVDIPTWTMEAIQNRSNATTVPITDVFLQYDQQARLDRKKLNDDHSFRNTLFNDAHAQMQQTDGLNQYFPDQEYPASFKEYCKYVSRAGQLHR